MIIGRKHLAFVILTLGALGLFWVLNNASSPILISNARAVPSSGNMYSVYMTLKNVGEPDVITDVVAKDAEEARIVGSGRDQRLVIPQGSNPSLSSDGAHIMLSLREGDLAEGEFIPLTLEFKEAGSVAVKAIVEKPTQMSAMDTSTTDHSAHMDHSMHGADAIFEIDDGQAHPKIEMLVIENSDHEWIVAIETENFDFFEPDVEPLAHKDGQGHGHLYLNGLKLQRMYSSKATIGALPVGKHTVSVTLNTNDHKAYSIDGELLTSVVEIEVK